MGLVFADLEGQADKGSSYDIKLSIPVLLISKVVLLNVLCPIGPSKEEILHLLEMMIHAANSLGKFSEADKPFGHLHLVLRDCCNEEEECWSIIFEEESVDDAETVEQAAAIEVRNHIRRRVVASFETTPRLWCLPKMEVEAPTNIRDAPKEYLEKIEEIRQTLAHHVVLPRTLNGRPVTGSSMVEVLGELMPLLQGSESPAISPPSLREAEARAEAAIVQRELAAKVAHAFAEEEEEEELTPGAAARAASEICREMEAELRIAWGISARPSAKRAYWRTEAT